MKGQIITNRKLILEKYFKRDFLKDILSMYVIADPTPFCKIFMN